MTEERKIRCLTTTTSSGRFGVIKAWLKMHHIEYDEKEHIAGSHFWTTMRYQLTGDEFTELILYLETAEVLDDNKDVII